MNYYYWIGERNDGGGYDGTGETGHVEAESAQAAANTIAFLGGDYGDAMVFARSADVSETAEARIR